MVRGLAQKTLENELLTSRTVTDLHRLFYSLRLVFHLYVCNANDTYFWLINHATYIPWLKDISGHLHILPVLVFVFPFAAVVAFVVFVALPRLAPPPPGVDIESSLSSSSLSSFVRCRSAIAVT
jgi:hypothetical protein